MATTKLGLPTITGNMTADVVRDHNALAQAIDDKAGAAGGLARLDTNGKVINADGSQSGEVTQEEFSGLEQTVMTHLAEKVPYTGATKPIDLNGQKIVRGTKDIITHSVDGIVSLPNQSFVHVNSSGTQSISSGVDTKVTILSSELIDTQSEFTSNRFTAKETGNYFVKLYSDWGGTVPTADIFLKLYKNGANWGTVAAGYAYRYIMGAAVVPLVAGDYIEFYVNQSSGGTAITLSGSNMQVQKLS